MRPRAKLGQQALLTSYRKSYEKSIGTKTNDLDVCLEVVSRSFNHCVTFTIKYLGTCLELAAQQVDEVLGRQSSGRHILSSF